MMMWKKFKTEKNVATSLVPKEWDRVKLTIEKTGVWYQPLGRQKLLVASRMIEQGTFSSTDMDPSWVSG
jgi:hypothetical protein